jgi:hypothetical protein
MVDTLTLNHPEATYLAESIAVRDLIISRTGEDVRKIDNVSSRINRLLEEGYYPVNNAIEIVGDEYDGLTITVDKFILGAVQVVESIQKEFFIPKERFWSYKDSRDIIKGALRYWEKYNGDCLENIEGWSAFSKVMKEINYEELFAGEEYDELRPIIADICEWK